MTDQMSPPSRPGQGGPPRQNPYLRIERPQTDSMDDGAVQQVAVLRVLFPE